ncbi:MAG TPA: hypothetical protein DCZ07_14885 [Alphaproteobacteria bacterium]|nr:hypothetical protein [Alphaproteobacteria bacterium]
MSHPFNEEYRFGSAAWANTEDLRRAGMLGAHGLPVGYRENTAMRLNGDAPLVTIGGAGSGKFRDILSYVACNSPGQSQVWLDPRGEISAVSEIAHTMNGDYAYRFNPLHLCSGISHKINPLEFLARESPSLLSDCKFVAEALVALTSGKDGNYFDLRARDWVEKLLISLVHKQGRVTLADLHRITSMIEGDARGWADHLEFMLACPYDGVRRAAAEMLTKQQDSPREFGSVMGSVYAALGFLDDPTLLESLNEAELSLFDLLRPGRKLFLNIPAEFLSLWSPLIRLVFTVVMLLKGRSPEAPRIMLIVDEAGQLGRFEALLRAFTFGRGAGVRAWAVFQDTGQISRNYGAPALQGFLGSAQMRQFFGVRDYQTARLVSDMLGTETLEYDDERLQDEARRQKRDAIRKMFTGDEDPFDAAREYGHYKRAEERRTKQSRPLMTPDEIMDMPEDRQILFISGKNLKPVYAAKYPYFLRRDMAGRFLPNPYHPPIDKVKVKAWIGTRTLKVVRERVPERFVSFPQYKENMWSYVKGYKPG